MYFEIEPGIYKHFKKGKLSYVFGTAKHSDNDSVLVLYYGLEDKQIHARPYESFVEKIEFNGIFVPRFELVTKTASPLDNLENMNGHLMK